MLVTEGLGGGMVVVVEESSHEQAAAIFSSSWSQTTGPPICLLRMVCLDVTCKQASEVWHSGYELTAYIVQARACVVIHCLVASSQCSKPRRESSTQTPTSPAQSLMFARPLSLAPSFSRASRSLTKPRDSRSLVSA